MMYFSIVYASQNRPSISNQTTQTYTKRTDLNWEIQKCILIWKSNVCLIYKLKHTINNSSITIAKLVNRKHTEWLEAET